MDHADRPLPPEFWSSPAVTAAMASCDLPTHDPARIDEAFCLACEAQLHPALP
ncbi:MAG: hypothetical protein J2P28_12595 [Actinobacteria bacterium]|nr:hypothetical protein [Actinomycetota bacterium]